MREYTTSRRNSRPGGRKPRLLPLVAAGTALVLCTALALFFVLQPKASALQSIAGPPYVIMLDAGHGGADTGAVALAVEKDVNARTVAHLYRLLQEDPDFTPLLTHAEDEGMGVNERAAAAKAAGAVVLFSIHANADAADTTRGFECFPVPPGRAWHAESLALARLVAEEMDAAGSPLRGEGGVRYAYYTDAGEKVFREASDARVSSQSSFGVLEQPGCIALLVEQCFLTNEEDVRAFATESGCSAAAACYYRALRAFFDAL